MSITTKKGCPNPNFCWAQTCLGKCEGGEVMVKTASDGLSDSYFNEGEIYQMMAEGESARSEVARLNERECVRAWNAAIDAAIALAEKMAYVTAEELRKLKKEKGE